VANDGGARHGMGNYVIIKALEFHMEYPRESYSPITQNEALIFQKSGTSLKPNPTRMCNQDGVVHNATLDQANNK
jgi:hypothetical protein